MNCGKLCEKPDEIDPYPYNFKPKVTGLSCVLFNPVILNLKESSSLSDLLVVCVIVVLLQSMC